MITSIGRPLEFDPDTALAAAMGLFWRKGYESTSLQDLLAIMGISRSSFYQTFGSKQQLFTQCMLHYQEMLTAQLRQALDSAESGRSFIADFMHSVLEETCAPDGARGCLILNTANEFAQRDPAIAQAVTLGIERVQAVLLAAVIRAQREGEIDPKRDPAILASYLISSMSGLKIMAKAGAGADVLQGIIDVALKALD
jgi:TetR/AcrR family transcriptional regulator, transcriptional repressor for nem operon